MNMCQCTGCKNTVRLETTGWSGSLIAERVAPASSVLDAVWLSLRCYATYLMEKNPALTDEEESCSPVDDLLERLGR